MHCVAALKNEYRYILDALRATYPVLMRRSDGQNLVALLSVLHGLDELQRGMPVSFLKALLLVGIDEGQTAAEYSRRAGIDRFQMSRYLRTLGRYNVKRKCDGFGWVEETRDKRYPNRKAIFLTPAGREILAQISDVLEHGKISGGEATRPLISN